MSGYLVNFFKYPPADLKSIDAISAIQNQIEEEDYSLVRNIVWSNLDRVEVRRIREFGSYRTADESEKRWIGERQFAMLYDLVDEQGAKLIYREENNKQDRCRFRFEPQSYKAENRDKYRFFGISMVSLSPKMKKYIFGQDDCGKVLHNLFAEILDKLRNSETAKFLSEYLEYEVYGTLGASDCAVVWLVNQYTDVIALIEALRQTKCTDNDFLVSNVYTIMGLSNPLSEDNIFENSKGTFNLRLIRRGNFEVESFRKTLEDYVESISDVAITLGKYDICVRFDSAAIKKNMYSQGGPLHFRTRAYSRGIFESHTELQQNSNGETIQSINLNLEGLEEFSLISNPGCFAEIRESIEKLTDAELFHDMPYLKETLWLLYQDFVKNIASEFSFPWSTDLEYSFHQSISYMKEILEKETEMGKNEIIDFIQNFFDSIRQTILHVSQAGKLYYEIPNSHLKQTGAYSKILRAYYGIVKRMLEIAYGIPKCNSQSEIIPFITFDVKPKAESEFFQSFYVQNVRVVNFELPYEALTDLPKYTKLLAHEIFHYIAPERRDIRNYLFGCIIWTEIIKTICYQRFISFYSIKQNKIFDFNQWKVSCGKIVGKLKSQIWNAVMDNYDLLMGAFVTDEWELWSKYLQDFSTKVLAAYRSEPDKVSTLSVLIKNIVESAACTICDEEECQKIILQKVLEDFKSENYTESFLCWYLTGDILRFESAKASDVVEACREAVADCFMIQVMDMTVAEYLELTLGFVDLYEENGDIQMWQQFRIGMILDYLWNKEGELSQEQINNTVDKMGLEDDQLNQLNQIWDSYCKYAKIYRKVFFYLFKTIDFYENQCEEGLIEKLNKDLTAYIRPGDAEIFDYNIRIIENMQEQKPLRSIFKLEYTRKPNTRNLKAISDMKSEFAILTDERKAVLVGADSQDEMPCVQSLEGLIHNFESLRHKLCDDVTAEPLWFRGHSSSKYKLIPSIYRIKDQKNYAYDRHLKRLMEDLINAFRVKSFHVPEIAPGGNASYLGTLVSMQHYLVETNLMDWSQQIFSALYFALEEYVNDPKKKIPDENARIYILNPARFNNVMKEEFKSKAHDGHYAIPALINDEEKYARYLPFLHPKDDGGTDDEYNYPFAMYAPYVNPRIKAQAGCFTIFSLSAIGEQEEGGYSYKKFDLENLQKLYKQKTKSRGTEYRQFLGYIDIDKAYVGSIAQSIRAMGITKKYVYPELSIVAQEMKEEIKNTYVLK